MAKKDIVIKPVAAAVGVAFVSSIALTGTAVADADDNPFELSDLDSGYMLAGGHKGEDGSCGEKGEDGKCGEHDGEGKGEDGGCGEKGEDGGCGEKGEEDDGEKGEDGKCGEGKCGGE